MPRTSRNTFKGKSAPRTNISDSGHASFPLEAQNASSSMRRSAGDPSIRTAAQEFMTKTLAPLNGLGMNNGVLYRKVDGHVLKRNARMSFAVYQDIIKMGPFRVKGASVSYIPHRDHAKRRREPLYPVLQASGAQQQQHVNHSDDDTSRIGSSAIVSVHTLASPHPIQDTSLAKLPSTPTHHQSLSLAGSEDVDILLKNSSASPLFTEVDGDDNDLDVVAGGSSPKCFDAGQEMLWSSIAGAIAVGICSVDSLICNLANENGPDAKAVMRAIIDGPFDVSQSATVSCLSKMVKFSMSPA